MKKYEVTLTARYEKTINIYAATLEQAQEKTETILYDTDLIDFTCDDFVCGEVDICDVTECELCGSIPDYCNESLPECSDCVYACPECSACMQDEDED